MEANRELRFYKMFEQLISLTQIVNSANRVNSERNCCDV